MSDINIVPVSQKVIQKFIDDHPRASVSDALNYLQLQRSIFNTEINNRALNGDPGTSIADRVINDTNRVFDKVKSIFETKAQIAREIKPTNDISATDFAAQQKGPVDLSNPSTPTPVRTEATGSINLQGGNEAKQINGWASKYSQAYLSGQRNAAPDIDVAADAASSKNPSEEDMKNYVQKFSELGGNIISKGDTNQDGKIDFNEFKALYESGGMPVFNFPQDYYNNPQNGLPKNPEDRIQNMFNCLSNGKGYIDANDATALNMLYDANGKTGESDGKISLEDHVIWSGELMKNSVDAQDTLKQIRQTFGLGVSSPN